MKTIAAITTAKGSAGIGVIRVSGEDAKSIADKVFKPINGSKLLQTPGYRARYGKIVDNDEEIDEGIALVFNSPNSYTGEDVVEISCHGGIYVTNRTLRAVFNAGAVPAEPGEFTKRAFLNGKIGLTQAESVMDIIGARGKNAARAALSNMEGALYKKIKGINERLIKTAAHLSAWADYPEDDIPNVDKDNLMHILDESLKELNDLSSNYDAVMAVKEGVDTAIIGKPNVGKSTLMNLLAGCDKSIVTNIPGTTRDIVEETVSLDDIMLRLSDTAGIRNTDDPVESIGVNKAKSKLKTAVLVLAVFDASESLSVHDMEILEALKDTPCVAIINKSDLENKIDNNYIKNKVKRTVSISAKDGEGIKELSKMVSELLGTNKIDLNDAVIANERQLLAVNNAIKCIHEAKEALTFGMTLDAVTVSVESAIQVLLELTGERASDAVVDGVFSHFCVGK